MILDDSEIWHGWRLQPEPALTGGGEKERRRNRLKNIRKHQLSVLNILEIRQPDLVRGTAGIKLDQGQVDELFEAIYQNTDGYYLKKRHNFLASGLARGKEEGLWNLPVPAPMVTVRRDPSPVRPDKFHALQALNNLNQLFESSLADPEFFGTCTKFLKHIKPRTDAPLATPQQLQAGQIIYSAIVNGGLLHHTWQARLGDAIRNHLYVDGNCLWLDLIEPSTTDDVPDLTRRWFPDPLTGLLILKWYKAYGQSWPEYNQKTGPLKHTRFLLERYFKSLGLKSNQRPSAPQLTDAAKTMLGMQLPQFFIHYASNKYTAPSLPAISWTRLRTGRRGKQTAGKATNESPLLKTFYQSRKRTNYPDQYKKLRHIQKLLGVYHHNMAPRVGEVCSAIENHLEKDPDLSPLVEALGQWCLEYMRSKRLTGIKIKPSSMKTFLSSIGPSLVRNATELNIHEMSETDWDNLYERVLEDSRSPKNRSYKAGRLVTFHRFLTMSYPVPDVYIARPTNERNHVDSNIVTPKEYKDILNTISRDIHQSERIRRIQRLLVILGYRCGLRRNEALTLQIHDLQDEQGLDLDEPLQSLRPELVIKNNLQGTVKNEKSIRRQPLSLLLTPSELTEFNQWKRLRLIEIEGFNITNHLLFCHHGQDLAPLNDKETFAPIHTVMQTVIGDASIHFHHLRHSLASILFLRLLEDDFPGILPNEWTNDRDQLLIPLPGKSIRSRLLLQKEGQGTRKWLYALSQLCGHIDPKETLDTYLHTLDWSMGKALKQKSPVLSSQIQANLLGISPGSLKVFRNRNSLKGATTASVLFDLQTSKIDRKLIDSGIEESLPPKRIPEAGNILAEFTARPPSPFQLYEIFRQHARGRSAPYIARSFGYNHRQIKEWIATTKVLANLESGKEKSRHVRENKIEEPVNIKEFLSRKPHLKDFSPAPPRHRRQDEFAQKIYDTLLKQYDANPEAIEQGLLVFLTEVTGSRGEIKIHHDEKLKDYIQLLKMSGISNNSIRVRLYSSQRGKSPTKTKYWTEMLELPKQCFSPELQHIPSNAKAAVTIIDETTQQPDSSGLRFALFMAGVYLNVIPEAMPTHRKITQLSLGL